MESARVIIEVVAGLIPGTPEPEFTKRFVVTSREWHEAGSPELAYAALRKREKEADEYAQQLREPSRLNWVRVDWIWL